MKLNYNGSVASSDFASCSGILRNSASEFVQAFVANVACCPVAIVQLWGAFHGLDMACSIGYREIMLELASSYAN